MQDTFLSILAKKYRLKYPCTYQQEPNTERSVKIQSLLLTNGDQISTKTDNMILTTALRDKKSIFDIFNINMEQLEGKLFQSII